MNVRMAWRCHNSRHASTQLHAMSMLPSISAFQRLGSWGLLKHNYAPVAMRVLVTTSSLCKCLSDSLRFAAPLSSLLKGTMTYSCHMWQILLVSDGNWLPSDAYFHSFEKFRWYFHQTDTVFAWFVFVASAVPEARPNGQDGSWQELQVPEVGLLGYWTFHEHATKTTQYITWS